MSPDTLKARSYALAQDHFYAADAIADAALEELADFGSRSALWSEGERHLLADLQARMDAAEQKRRQALNRLLYTFTEFIQIAS